MFSLATEKVSTRWHGWKDAPRSESLRECSGYADVETVKEKKADQEALRSEGTVNPARAARQQQERVNGYGAERTAFKLAHHQYP